MDPLADIARRHSLVLIEDAAQAHGAEYKGRRAGSLGHMGCFSFYPTKNLGACGEGGMVVTDNSEYAKKIRMLRNWGEDRKYHHALRGYNYRMEGMQGAILGVKLRHLERWTEQRRAHAMAYNKLLAGSGLELPKEIPQNRHVYHTFTVRSRDRDELQKQLTARGVQTAIHYPTPVHLQPAYMQREYHEGSFPVSERFAREVLSLPIYPEMTRKQLEEVAAAVTREVGAAR
jgi:dTDP-4-amino-4,6-dideoxygalactose transaminase